MNTNINPTNEKIITDYRLGKLPAISKRTALHLTDFLFAQTTGVKLPEATNFWTKRTKFPLHTWGNNEHGCCTIASQALASLRMERLEQRKTVTISTDEVLRVYYAMTGRLYGGGDTGAYEVDALSNWRKPDLTFRDTKGRPYTIDAYLRVNHTDMNAVKTAIFLSAAHGQKVCFNLPLAWYGLQNPDTEVWDIPEGQPLVGAYTPGTWGGHSMWALDYNKRGVVVGHTWGIPDQLVTWRGVMTYMDEAHLVIDSVNSWKKKASAILNIDGIVEAVNAVSDQKIK